MQISFSIIYLFVFLSAIMTNWRTLDSGAGKIIFVGLGVLSLGTFLIYWFKLSLFFPTRWVVNRIVPHIIGILQG